MATKQINNPKTHTDMHIAERSSKNINTKQLVDNYRPNKSLNSDDAWPLEVENKISMHIHPSNIARWDINKDTGKIVLFIPSIWDEAVKHSDINDPDDCFRTFVGVTIFSYLMERICIERAHEKIRLKRSKCNPCAVAPITNKMFDYILDSYD